MQLLRPQRKLKRHHPRRLARNRVITAPNQLWEVDLKYGWVAGEQRFFYVASILDVFDRKVVAYHMGLSCSSWDIALALQEGILKRGSPRPVVRTDNGPQFIGQAFEQVCLKLGLEHERIPFRTPNKNAHIEAFHRILEEECLNQYFENYAEAYSMVVTFMEFYNTERLHGSIGFLSPEEYGEGGNYLTMNLKEVRV